MKLPTTGAYTVEVVGESHHQSELRWIAGGPTKEGHYKRVTATLRPEPKNKHDSNAVRVEISRRHVGYLDRESAKVYQTWLVQHGHAGAVATCPAVITGGFKRDGDSGQYGVVLDLGVKGVKRRFFAPHAPTKAQRVGRKGMPCLLKALLILGGLFLLAAVAATITPR
jgi:hypothetical protein